MRRKWRAVGVLLAALLLWQVSLPARTQGHTGAMVVLVQQIDAVATRLIFVDVVSGAETQLETYGERYTILAAARAVMFYEPVLRQVMVAHSDGRLEAHPFIQMDSGARRADWVIAADASAIAWTITRADASGQLVTRTQIAAMDGSGAREVLVDGPRDGLRAYPVAFSSDHAQLYMDYQPDGMETLVPYPQYAGLFAVDLTAAPPAVPEFLPDEPGDFTGAGFGAGYFLRLALTNDLSGFDVRVYHLATGFNTVIPALRLRGYTQAGDILVAPNGKYAVYALSQITAFGAATQSVQTVFMLVDLVTMTQSELTDPITTFVRPTAWTEDNSAIIFTSPQTDGTWKVNLRDGRLQKIAELAYIGVLP